MQCLIVKGVRKMKKKDKDIFLPTKDITLIYCSPPVGSFAVEKEKNKLTQWDHCREQFAAKFDDKIVGFYFSHKAEKAEDIVAFLHKFEKIIQKSNAYPKLKFSDFGLTSVPHILYIEPSNFWKDCFFKRSLFTLVLRCGQNYSIKDDNFDDALFGYQHKESNLMIETKPAVMRFMFGFTKYTGITPVLGQANIIKHGWKEEFHKLDESEIKNRLVLPDGVKKPSNIVGSESIWN
jgi:hypothetical protein